jgi:hypothetical protein
MNDHIAGTPPPPMGPAQRLVQIGPGDELTGLVISEKMWGVSTHWRKNGGPRGRSERCIKDKGECQGCKDELPTRWKAYIEVWCHRRRRPVFVELTQGAYQTLTRSMKEGQPIRGLTLHCQRKGKTAQTNMLAWFTDSWCEVERLPPPSDPEPTLETLWTWQR